MIKKLQSKQNKHHKEILQAEILVQSPVPGSMDCKGTPTVLRHRVGGGAGSLVLVDVVMKRRQSRRYQGHL